MTEADLIARIKQRAAGDPSLVVGIGDDAAIIRPEPGRDLVASTDTLIEGAHFDTRFSPADIGHLALASNLSDLAAMGASPRWVLLSLTLPEANLDWLDGFLDGFLALAAEFNVVLAGGNLARGPMNITVQALGEVEEDAAVPRTGAGEGDLLVVSGTVGDAAAALVMDNESELENRLRRPRPRVAAGRALARHTHAMLDLSDGLLADLRQLLAPGQGARIELSTLPASAALLAAVPDAEQRWRLQLGGGSDYELLAAVPPSCRNALESLAVEAGVPLTVIGRVDYSGRIGCRRDDGSVWQGDVAGWDHFSEM